MMRSIILLVASLILAACTTTSAAYVCNHPDPTRNVTWWIEFTYKNNREMDNLRHKFLLGDDLQVFLAAVNKSPPETNNSADAVIVFEADSYPGMVIGFVKDGCMVEAHEAPAFLVRMWMKGKPAPVPKRFLKEPKEGVKT